MLFCRLKTIHLPSLIESFCKKIILVYLFLKSSVNNKELTTLSHPYLRLQIDVKKLFLTNTTAYQLNDKGSVNLTIVQSLYRKDLIKDKYFA